MAKKNFRQLKGQVARKEKLTKSELQEFNKLSKYRSRAKKLRETNAFGDLFKGEKANLLYPEKWSPAMKAKVTRYAKELGPLIASETKTKRYFRDDHLKSAIEVSPQEKLLPGQKAALFPVDDFREDVVIVFDSKHRPTVTRDGITEKKINFNRQELALNAMDELKRTLETAPGKFFKFVTGANESRRTMNKSEMIDAMERMIMNYDPDDKPLGDFIYGIKAYPNIRSAKRLMQRDIKHSAEVTKRQRGRLSEKAKTERALTKAEKVSMRRGRTK